MTIKDDTKALRLQLLANGYTPIPNVGKMTFLKGWPTVKVDEAAIAEWGRRHSRWADTGLRVENGLAVIDIDVNDPIVDKIQEAIEAAYPALLQSLVRFGKGHKVAWFCRTSEPFTRIHTRRWLKPGGDLDKDGTHVVEIFGGQSPRQFGAFGAHTRAQDGSIEVSYEWAADEEKGIMLGGTFPESPESRPLDSLPELDKADYFAIADLSEKIMEAEGWTPVIRTTKGESEATRVYDLTDDMLFETNTGEDGVTLQALRDRRGEDGLRVSASFIEPGREHSRTRCLIGVAHSGEMTVWDSATGVTHMPKSAAPDDAEKRNEMAAQLATRLALLQAVDHDRLGEAEAEKKARRRASLSAEDTCQQAASKLLQSYAMCPTQQLQVVPLYAESVMEGMTLTNFRSKMLPWVEIEIGPRGGEVKINPVDVWASSKQRTTVEGLRLRPDMPRPVYDDAGKRFINIYSPVIHNKEGGNAQAGIDFFEQLLPDRSEREWFTRWLAFKLRQPAIPGPAVVMVARSYGTGRGTLGELLRRLFGARYVRALPFEIFAGKTYQSQYNSWGAETLMVCVNESSDAQGGSVYASKRDTYERLKDLIEPRPIERHFVRHGLPPFTALSFTSYCIFTQHVDALPLPADDRRFWVGTNGEPREAEYWEQLNMWMEDEANITAFARWLAEYDLADYSPFAAPPMTKGKAAMSDMALSPLDHAFTEAVTFLPGKLMVPDQVLAAMREAARVNGWDLPDRWEPMAKRMVSSKLDRIAEKDAANWQIRIDGHKHAVYVRPLDARLWRGADGEAVRREVLKNGTPGSSTANIGERIAAGLRVVAEREETK